MKERVVLEILDGKIAEQIKYIDLWRRPEEPLLFEVLRALDYVFCKELIETDCAEESQAERWQHQLQSWGVNKALQRMLPANFVSGPFHLFPSNRTVQRQADEFLLHCGIAEKAEALRGWLAEGLLDARVETSAHSMEVLRTVLILESNDPSLNADIVTRTQRKWLGDLFYKIDRSREEALEKRHVEILPELNRRVDVFRGWGVEYSSTMEIDRYFDEWGQLYLRRMWSQDLIGLEDKIGGNQFNEYLGILAAVSGRSQKHICFANLIKARHPQLDWRNLLTTFSPFNEFVKSLAVHLDADCLQVQKLLSAITLEPTNKDAHLGAGQIAWAPIVRSNQDHCILPVFGLEINPFHFLLTDLRHKYPTDWDRLANAREKRWRDELNDVFCSPRWMCSPSGVPLRSEGRTVTDIDALVFDSENNEIGIFQLKWQQPVGVHGRQSRSAARNFAVESNKWIDAVSGWMDQNGLYPLLARLGVKAGGSAPRVFFFVLGRYKAQFAGRQTLDQRAAWADWPHFIRGFVETGGSSLGELHHRLRENTASIIAKSIGESCFIPLGDTAVLLNPKRHASQD